MRRGASLLDAMRVFAVDALHRDARFVQTTLAARVLERGEDAPIDAHIRGDAVEIAQLVAIPPPYCPTCGRQAKGGCSLVIDSTDLDLLSCDTLIDTCPIFSQPIVIYNMRNSRPTFGRSR